jgi:Ca-activated chloride channel homolog
MIQPEMGSSNVSRLGSSALATALLLCLLAFSIPGKAQDAPRTPPRSTPPPASTQQPAANPPAKADQQAPTDSGAAISGGADDSNDFVFKKAVDEVVLHAIVVDAQNRLITDLPDKSFIVHEDGKLQNVTSFRKERVPVALGILIDNSGSMLPKRAKVNEAAMQLVAGSQEGDKVFVVNFGEDAFLDQDYTQDVGKLKTALQHIETRGSTALYDALIGAVDHLTQTSPPQKKILLAVTDGHDNASQATMQEALRKLQSKDGPVLYIVALNEGQPNDAADRQSLTSLSEATGGTAFFPSSPDEIQSIASSIARDIRSQYVLTYRSSNSHATGVYHQIQVQAQAQAGPAPLRVQTRTGYYSGELNKEQSQNRK